MGHLPYLADPFPFLDERGRLHILAHSRGTDVTMTALRELHLEYRGRGVDTGDELKLANVVLAAPDLDLEVAVQRLRPDLVILAPKRFTMYVSKGDKAIGIAEWLFSSVERLGQLRAEALTEGGEGGALTLQKIVKLVNKTLKLHKGLGAPELSSSEVVDLINKGGGAGGKGRHWVLDPVDGTLGFVRGDQYAIALAMMEDGDLKVGVMGCPNMPKMGEVLEYDSSYTYGFSPRLVSKMLAGESLGWYKGCMFTAVKGEGAYMLPCDPAVKADPLPVSVSKEFDPQAAKFCEPVMKANSSQGFTASVADNLGIESKPLRVYSQVKYGSVARADADVFMKFPKAGYKEKIWDHAAGVIIVEEAGGVVTDAGGTPLDWAGGRYLESLDRGIVATSKALHERLMDAVSKSWSSSQL